MTSRELREKYGKSNVIGAINAAIRHECPGGNAALDALELMLKIMRRKRPGTEEYQIARLAYNKLLEIVEAMEEDIKIRYNIGRNAT